MTQEEVIRLRVHHLLCSVLFEGKGYSQDFVKNMTHIVTHIERDSFIQLITEPDIICASCPHKTEQFRCDLDHNEVEGKDERLLKALQLKKENPYKASALFRWVNLHMTREIFEESCGNCQWKQEGICSYEKYKTNSNLQVYSANKSSL